MGTGGDSHFLWNPTPAGDVGAGWSVASSRAAREASADAPRESAGGDAHDGDHIETPAPRRTIFGGRRRR